MNVKMNQIFQIYQDSYINASVHDTFYIAWGRKFTSRVEMSLASWEGFPL